MFLLCHSSTTPRRHHIPQARYWITNSLGALLRSWPAYKAGLRRRGDLTIWVDEATLAGWQAPRRSTPGGQQHYSELAIGLALTLRLVFHLALRQAEGFARSVLQLLGMALPVPDHTTHGRLRRRWLKLHLGVDASTGEIAAHVLTDGDPDQQTLRDRHVQLVEPVQAASRFRWDSPDMAERGRIGWQRATGYGTRNHAETTMGRYKHLIGPKLRAHTRPTQLGGVALAVQVLNRMIREAKPVSLRR